MKRGSRFVLNLFLILIISLSFISAGFFSDFFDGITGKVSSDTCGNDIIEGTELCDGTDLGGFSCSSFGFVGGSLNCNSDCDGFDTIQCTSEPTVICGNGILEPGEQCDGTNFGSITCEIFGYPPGELTCSSSCRIDISQCIPKPTVCGDGTIQSPNDDGQVEQCDDGNLVDGDGCSSTCTDEGTTYCSDGTIQTPNDNGETEFCDDGNVLDGDGCSTTCTIESGWECSSGTPSVCTQLCGDGVIDDGETCDDGNTVSGDGCSSTCQIEEIIEADESETGTDESEESSPVGSEAEVDEAGATLNETEEDIGVVAIIVSPITRIFTPLITWVANLFGRDDAGTQNLFSFPSDEEIAERFVVVSSGDGLVDLNYYGTDNLNLDPSYFYPDSNNQETITILDQETGQIYAYNFNSLESNINQVIQRLAFEISLENSYIVEFNEPPVLAFYSGEQISGAPSPGDLVGTESQREKIRGLHERFADDVEAFDGTGTGNIIRRLTGLITGKVTEGDSPQIINAYENSFSGVSVIASKETIEEIKSFGYVKKVYPNQVVFTTLVESVPLIGAPDVWQLDEDGENCETSGKECLTGKGITIAIIDTGVDYTHPDLGGEFCPEVGFCGDGECSAENNEDAISCPQDCETTFEPGWPVEINNVQFTPVVANIDNDSEEEILIYSMNLGFDSFREKLFVFNHDGTPVQGFPIEMFGTFYGVPLVEDINNNGEKEILLSNLLELNIFKNDGSIMEGFPQPLNTFTTSMPFVIDMDNDGEKEIIVGTGFFWGDNGEGKIYVFDDNGDYVAPWPKPLGEDYRVSRSSPVVGDIDGDGELEIIHGAIKKSGKGDNSKIYAWNFDGSLVEGFPVELQNNDLNMIDELGNIVLADADNDGIDDIFVVSFQNKIYGIKGDGTSLPGWPKVFTTYLWPDLIFSDVDGNGEKDLLFASYVGYDIYAYNLDGSEVTGWPKNSPEIILSFNVGDIDLDGNNDILINSPFGLTYAIDQQEKIINGWPKKLFNSASFSHSIISDIDLDNNIEIIIPGNHGPYFYVYEQDRNQESITNLESIVSLNNKEFSPQRNENTDLRGLQLIKNADGSYLATLDTTFVSQKIFSTQAISQNCKVIGGYDFINNDADPMDDHGHGTHVAATAAGKDPDGVFLGVAPDAKILAYKVLNSRGSGTWSGVIAGIERAVDPNQDGDFSDKADIISISLGGPGNPDDPVSRAVDAAVESGVVAVIAAGNSGPRTQTIGSPGTARKAITVGAVDKNENIARFSSRGPVLHNGEIIMKPDIVAPGVSICAAQWEDAWESGKCSSNPDRTAISGTSMATPHVAGVVALIKQANPDWTPEKIKSAIKNTAKIIGDRDIFKYGDGIIDTEKAIRASVFTTINFLDFGVVDESSSSWNKLLEITIENTNDFDVMYTLNTEISGFQLENKIVSVDASIDFPSFVTVSAGSAVEVNIILQVNNPIEKGDYSNALLFSPDRENVNSLKLPIRFRDADINVYLNKIETNKKVEIQVSSDYSPTSFEIEITAPDSNKISIIPENILPNKGYTFFQPKGPEGTYMIKAVAKYGDSEVYGENSFVLDKTPPILSVSTEADENVILTANEDISPYSNGPETILRRTNDTLYDFLIFDRAKIFTNSKGNLLIATEKATVKDETVIIRFRGNVIEIHEYDPDTQNFTNSISTELQFAPGGDRVWWSGYDFIVDEGDDIYLIAAKRKWIGNSKTLEILLFKSNPVTNTFDQIELLYTLNERSFPGFHRVKVLLDKNNDLHVFWLNSDPSIAGFSSKILYKKVDLFGTTLINTQIVSRDEYTFIFQYDIAIDSNNDIYLFVVDNTANPPFYRKLDLTDVWSSAINLDTFIAQAEFDSDDELHVVWSDNLLLRRSKHGIFDLLTNEIVELGTLKGESDKFLLKNDGFDNIYTLQGTFFKLEPLYLYRYDTAKNKDENICLTCNEDPHLQQQISDMELERNSVNLLIRRNAQCPSFTGLCPSVSSLAYNRYNFPSAKIVDQYLPITYEGNNQYRIITEGETEGLVITASDLAGNIGVWETIDTTPPDVFILAAPDTIIPTATVACSDKVPIVSDTRTLADGNPSVPTFKSDAWTAEIPGARWIWSEEFVSNPEVNTTVEFTRTFDIPNTGDAPDGILVIAADNSYDCSLNDLYVGGDQSERNFGDDQKDTYDLSGKLVIGENRLVCTVKNWEQPGGTAQTNPAGLLYKLSVYGGCDENSYQYNILDTEITQCPASLSSYTPGNSVEITGHVWACGYAKDNAGNEAFSEPVEFNICAPDTCTSLGVSCGTPSDSCGRTLNCGSCIRGVTNCVGGSCVPIIVCAPDCAGKSCGDDGCGGSCGSCSTGFSCDAGGICVAEIDSCGDCGDGLFNFCDEQECNEIGEILGVMCIYNDGFFANTCTEFFCTPDTCAGFGYECGIQSDGCGGTLNCGSCSAGASCDAGGICFLEEPERGSGGSGGGDEEPSDEEDTELF